MKTRSPSYRTVWSFIRGNSRVVFRFIGLFILIFIISKIDIAKTFKLLGSMKLAPLAVVVLSCPLTIFMRVARWKLLLFYQKIAVPYLKLLHFYMASFFWGGITPARVGELVRAYYLKQQVGCSGWKAISSVVTDRILDVIFAAVGGVTGLLFFHMLNTKVAMMILIIMFIPACFILFSKRASEYFYQEVLSKLLGGKFLKSYRDTDEEFSRGMTTVAGKNMVIPFMVTGIIFGVYFLQARLLAYSLGIDIKYIETSLALSAAMLIAMIPITVAGIGTREAVLIFLLGQIGKSPEEAVSFSFALFIIFFVFILILGFAFYMFLPYQFKRKSGD